MSRQQPRNHFTSDEDKLLVKFLAVYLPSQNGRLGNGIYKLLVENKHKRWPWSARHPWQSWRNRYKSNQADFDFQIRKYQKKHNIVSGDPSPWRVVTAAREESESASKNESDARSNKRKATDSVETGERMPKRVKQEKDVTSERRSGEKASNGPSPQVARQIAVMKHIAAVKASQKPVPSTQAKKPARAVSNAEKDDDEQAGSVEVDDYANEVFAEKQETDDDDEEEDEEQQMVEGEDGAVAGQGTTTNGSTLQVSAHSTNRPPSKTVPMATLPPKPRTKMLKRNHSDDDPFESSPSKAPSPPPAFELPTQKRKPLVYKEGPYRAAFEGAERKWPPQRGRSLKEGVAAGVTSVTQPQPTQNGKDSVVPQAALPSQATTISPPPPGQPRPRQYVEVSAVASSSKVQLPPSSYQTAEEVISSIQPEAPSAQPRSPGEHVDETSFMSSASNPSKPQPTNADAKQVPPAPNGAADGAARPRAGTSAPVAVKSTGKEPAGPIPQSTSAQVKPRHKVIQISSRRTSGIVTGGSTTLINDSGDINPASIHDVFLDVAKIDRRGETRKRPDTLPRVDLREASALMSKARASMSSNSGRRESLDLSSLIHPSRSSSVSRRSRYSESFDVSTLPQDIEYFQMLGRQKALADLAKRYGFAEDIATEAYNGLKDLKKTETYLSRLANDLGSVGKQIWASMVSEGGSGSEGLGSSTHSTRNRPTARPDADVNPVKKAKRHRRRSSPSDYGLKIRPFEDDRLSEYTPPRSSRAGRYTRSLLKQGRAAEALALQGRPSVDQQSPKPNGKLSYPSPRRQASSPASASPSHRSPSSSPVKHSSGRRQALTQSSPGDAEMESEEEKEEGDEQPHDSPQNLQNGSATKEEQALTKSSPQDAEMESEEEQEGEDEHTHDGSPQTLLKNRGATKKPVEEEDEDDDRPASAPASASASMASDGDESDEPEIDPDVLEQERVYHWLSSTVTRANAEKMRKLEGETDPDHAVLFSLRRLRQLLPSA